MTAFYNEVDPFAAQWLRNLIAAGHIAPGVVDERDIRDIEGWELHEYTQCHFFAGIGVWSHALRRAGWPDDQPIWTGSCPCQPFSNAGKKKGFGDERHLWPTWYGLIDQCRPPVVAGEQVASKDGLQWSDLVRLDLETSGYAFGASDLCAAGFQGAHIRQRLYFLGVADDDDAGPQGRQQRRHGAAECPAGATGLAVGLADATDADRRPGECGAEAGTGAHGERRRGPASGGSVGGADAPMLGRNPADWLYCRDGKWRPVEPGTFPLADAPPARVGRLRAYGNALDAETAYTFCTVLREITGV